MSLSRRQILAGAAAAAAGAAMPASAVADATPATIEQWYAENVQLWEADRYYRFSDLVWFRRRLRVVTIQHVSSGENPEQYLSGPLRIGSDSFLVEDPA